MAKSNKKIVTLLAAAAASSFLLILLMFEGNHELYIVTSSSMVPTLNPGDAALISRDVSDHSAFAQLKRGDIIIFEASSLSKSESDKRTIVHRIMEIETDSGGKRIILTKGDANPSSIQGVDYHITEDSYVGKVIYEAPYLGLLLMYINLLAQIVMQPIFYFVIGSVIAIAFLLEYKKKKRN
jgi:signal peptidase I